MSWNTTVTNKGSALITTAIQNGDIEFTRALGSTNLSGTADITTVTEVSEPQHSVLIKSVDVIGDNTRIVLRIMNDGVTEDYSIKQIGIFAKLKDSDEEILFSISENPYGQEVPSVENCPEFVCDVYIIVRVDNRIKQSVSVQSGIYAEIGHTHRMEDIEGISNQVQMIECPSLVGVDVKTYAENYFSDESDVDHAVEFAVRIKNPLNAPDESSNGDFFFKGFKINSRKIHILAIDMNSSNVYECVQLKTEPLPAGQWLRWRNISDGGNADMLDGKHAGDLLQNLKFWDSGNIKDLVLKSNSGFTTISSSVTGMPIDNLAWVATVNASSSHRQIIVHPFGSPGKMYIMIYNAATSAWSEWSTPDSGNADMVDGKHASDLLQNFGYLNSGSLLDYVLTMKASGFLYVSSAVTDTPVAGQFFFVDVRRYENGSYAITATRFNAGGVYTNRYNSNADMKKWYGWSNVADGGNAITLNGISSSEYLRQPRHGVEVGTNPATATDTRGIYFKGKTGDTYATAGIMNAVDTSGNVATTIDARNNTTSGQKIYRLFIKVGIDGTGFLSVTAPSSSGISALRNLAGGSSAATTSNCPAGSWYGQYE